MTRKIYLPSAFNPSAYDSVGTYKYIDNIVAALVAHGIVEEEE